MSAEEKVEVVETPKVEVVEVPKPVEQKEYLLTIRVKFQAFDDAEARVKAKTELADFGVSEDEIKNNVKFQRLKKDGAPEKVEL